MTFIWNRNTGKVTMLLEGYPWQGCGVGAVDWKGACRGLLEADDILIFCFSDLLLITQVWSVCGNSLKCTFMISSLKISVTYLFLLFFAAAGLHHFRNNFRKLGIWQFLPSDIKPKNWQQALVRWDWLVLTSRLQGQQPQVGSLKSATENATNQSFPCLPAHHWTARETKTKQPLNNGNDHNNETKYLHLKL